MMSLGLWAFAALLVADADAAFAEYMKGKRAGESALGFRHYSGEASNSVLYPGAECTWTWTSGKLDERGLTVPIWTCPPCNKSSGNVFFLSNLRRCTGRYILTLSELAKFNAECDWVEGRLDISIGDHVELTNLVRIAGTLYLSDEVKSFTAPKLEVASVIEVRGTSTTTVTFPALHTICQGSVIISSSSTLRSFSAPHLRTSSSFGLQVQDLGSNLTLDLGSVGGGPSKLMGRVALHAVGASIIVSGLTNVKEVVLTRDAPSITYEGLVGQTVCPGHGAAVSFSGQVPNQGGDFHVVRTDFLECTLASVSLPTWTNVRIQNNRNLRSATAPIVSLTQKLVLRSNPQLKAEFVLLKKITGALEFATQAPPLPRNVLQLPVIDTIGGTVLIDVQGTMSLIDIGSVSGGPVSLQGSLHLVCDVSCGQLKGFTKLATLRSLSGTDYVRIEGVKNVGTSFTSHVALQGTKAEVTFRRNNWEVLPLTKSSQLDTWGPLTVAEMPYLTKFHTPLPHPYDFRKVGQVMVSNNPNVPQSCTATAVWGKPVIANGNHPDTSRPCPDR